MSINKSVAQKALQAARNEIQEEQLQKAVSLYKSKLKEQQAAETVLKNIQREIAELELKIDQGNI